MASPGLLKLESKLKTCWEEILLQEELMLYQKSRVQWLQCGDRNTNFFHISILVRRRRNRIEALQAENGRWESSQAVLKEMALSYFKELYNSNPEANDAFLLDAFPCLSSMSLSDLSRPYSKEEIWSALKGMGAWKAPGPDGLQSCLLSEDMEYYRRRC